MPVIGKLDVGATELHAQTPVEWWQPPSRFEHDAEVFRVRVPPGFMGPAGAGADFHLTVAFGHPIATVEEVGAIRDYVVGIVESFSSDFR